MGSGIPSMFLLEAPLNPPGQEPVLDGVQESLKRLRPARCSVVRG